MSIINKPFLTEIQLAERWNVSTKTLQNWRKVGKGPRYHKINRAVRYSHEIVEKYEHDHLTASTSQGAEV